MQLRFALTTLTILTAVFAASLMIAQPTSAAIQTFIGSDDVGGVLYSNRGTNAKAARDAFTLAIGTQGTQTFFSQGFEGNFNISQGAFNAGGSISFPGFRVVDGTATNTSSRVTRRSDGIGNRFLGEGGIGSLTLFEVGNGEPVVAMDFVFDTAVDFFGLWLGENGNTGFAQVSFSDGATQTFNFAGNTNGVDQISFFGAMTDSNPISSIKLSLIPQFGSSVDTLVVDDLVFGTLAPTAVVPEPTTLIVWSLLSLTVGSCRRRSRGCGTDV